MARKGSGMAHKGNLPASVRTAWRWGGLALGAVLFFLAQCLCAASTSRATAVLLILLALSAAFLFYERLRDRLKPPMLALTLVVVMDGLSTAYAVSGKFALNEFLKVLCAFCLALLLLALTGREKPERRVAEVLAACCAIAGLVSIDLLSTRWISTPVLALLGQFTPDFGSLSVVEEGVRMTSLFINPNVFAGCMGLGVLLSLGLAATAEKTEERAVYLVCLSVNALAFILAFSMGACAAIVPAFLVFLALTGKEERVGLLILMVETLAVTVLAAFPISVTSMTAWDGVRPIPLLCTVGGAAALCALDLLAGRRLAVKLAGHGKGVLCLAGGILAALVIFVIAACNLTTGVTLQGGESLRRSAYPEPGAYTLTAEGSGDPTVIIESQNRADTMMHTSSELYRGPLSQAAFTVPEDSMVVWFSFRTQEETRLDRVEFTGESGSSGVPLGYRLLPGFIANRLQGLWANQNAIQRFVFFEDGIKLFQRSPIIGLGLGAFENGVRSVQTFRYNTKYAHNHYIQTLAETGIIGLVLFLGLLAVSAVSVWRARKKPFAPALGAALVFMAAHGAVELVFSGFAYLPIAFGVFAIINLYCGDALPLPAQAKKPAVRNGLVLGILALEAVFGVLLGCNISAQNIARRATTLGELEQAARLDPFEKADYMLSYVVSAARPGVSEQEQQKADEYALLLGKIDSNTIPIYLAEYYLKTDRAEEALVQAERYVRYVSADGDVWQDTFDLLEKYEQDTETYRAGVTRIAALMDAWNEENMGYIGVSAQTKAFIERMRT